MKTRQLKTTLNKVKGDPDKFTITICRDVLEIMGFEPDSNPNILLQSSFVNGPGMSFVPGPKPSSDCGCK